jgi:hypothetical protein
MLARMSGGAGAERLSVDVSREAGLITVRLAGHPTSDSIVRMLEDLDRMVAQDPSLRVLIDETQLRPTLFSVSDIRRFAEVWQHATALRATRLAVFVTNPAMYGLNRMFQSLADAHGRMDAFRDRASALAWLREGTASDDVRP